MFSTTLERHPNIARIATRMIFLSAGFITAAWAALIPFVKTNVQINDGMMGILLLCLGAGALVGMPIAGWCTAKFGCQKVLLISVVSFSLIFPALLSTQSPIILALILVAFGLCIGITDCAMNIQAVIVEKSAHEPLMSGFHGFYSLGGMVGALVLTGLFSVGVTAAYACMLTSVLMLILLAVSHRGLLANKASENGPYFALPRGEVILIGVVCFVFFLAEGSVLDWSGIFLTEYRNVPLSSAGMGVASFSVAMTIGRLFGDRLISFIGAKRMVVLGASIAIIGFLLSLLVTFWQSALVGYALIGLGCANIVPIMFSATGKQHIMSESLAVTAVSTLGYIGVLAGPALLGFGAQMFSLSTALYGVVTLVSIAIILSIKIKL